MADVRLSLPTEGPISYRKLMSLAEELEADGLSVAVPPRPIEKKGLDWETAGCVLEIAVNLTVLGTGGVGVSRAVRRWLKRKRHPNQLPVVGVIYDEHGRLLREVRATDEDSQDR